MLQYAAETSALVVPFAPAFNAHSMTKAMNLPYENDGARGILRQHFQMQVESLPLSTQLHKANVLRAALAKMQNALEPLERFTPDYFPKGIARHVLCAIVAEKADISAADYQGYDSDALAGYALLETVDRFDATFRLQKDFSRMTNPEFKARIFLRQMRLSAQLLGTRTAIEMAGPKAVIADISELPGYMQATQITWPNTALSSYNYVLSLKLSRAAHAQRQKLALS